MEGRTMDFTTHMYTELCVAAQDAYCKDMKLPRFIDSDGNCDRCGRNIFDRNFGGYSLEDASKKLITGCPFCRHSFCD